MVQFVFIQPRNLPKDKLKLLTIAVSRVDKELNNHKCKKNVEICLNTIKQPSLWYTWVTDYFSIMHR